MFGSNNLENHPELYCEANQKLLGKITIETQKTLDRDEFAVLGAKAYGFTCDNGEESRIE